MAVVAAEVEVPSSGPLAHWRQSLDNGARSRRFLLFTAPVLIAFAEAVRAQAAPQGASLTQDDVAAFVMHWFTEMQAGRTDRSQYEAGYNLQLTDEAVREMSRALNRYGAAPFRAEIVQTRTSGQQTLRLVKFLFPRGDATSLLFGFDPAGKITGVGVRTLAGD